MICGHLRGEIPAIFMGLDNSGLWRLLRKWLLILLSWMRRIDWPRRCRMAPLLLKIRIILLLVYHRTLLMLYLDWYALLLKRWIILLLVDYRNLLMLYLGWCTLLLERGIILLLVDDRNLLMLCLNWSTLLLEGRVIVLLVDDRKLMLMLSLGG